MRKKILVVDDARTMLLVEEMILRKGPYELVTAVNGLEALEKAEAERPDLILMDVVMPGMDGFAACRELRAREATRTTPIILLTTRSEAVNVEQGWASGCTDYLLKPIDAGELLNKVRLHVGD